MYAEQVPRFIYFMPNQLYSAVHRQESGPDFPYIVNV
jgi:hypothetical protein